MTFQKKQNRRVHLCIFTIFSPAYSLNALTKAFGTWYSESICIEDVQCRIIFEIGKNITDVMTWYSEYIYMYIYIEDVQLSVILEICQKLPKSFDV